jgi:CRP-like cAMP-binding protein
MEEHGIELDLPVAQGAHLLQRVGLFQKLGFQETVLLSQICKSVQHADGHVIIHQDSLGQALYILREGSAVVRRRDPITGHQHDLATLSEGELFGEMSLVDDHLASADVVASGPVSLLMIPRREFESLVADHDKLAIKVYRCFCAALAERLRHANEVLAERD